MDMRSLRAAAGLLPIQHKSDADRKRGDRSRGGGIRRAWPRRCAPGFPALAGPAPAEPAQLPGPAGPGPAPRSRGRSEEHTSELQSLMRISYAVFCLKKQKTNNTATELQL